MKTMHVLMPKKIKRKMTGVLIVCCCLISVYISVYFSVYFSVWNKAPHPTKTDRNTKTKIGILIPFDSISFSINHSVLELNSKNGKYGYKYFLKGKTIVDLSHIKETTTNDTIASVEETTHKFRKLVNQLADKAYEDGMDYFILICNGTQSNKLTRNFTNYLVQKLREHVVPNIGVVVAIEPHNGRSAWPYLIVIHRSHKEIFHHFFTSRLDVGTFKTIQWILDIYGPYHITEVQLNSEAKFSMEYRGSDLSEGKYLKTNRNKINEYIIARQSVRVVSYSLFGSDPRYTDGALANTDLIKTIYPGWKLWLYHDNTVPLNILFKICKQVHVKCINMTRSKLTNKMSWRFLVASVPFVSRYIIRDVDSRLSLREKSAVDEWIASGEKFHVMRDHPSHSNFAMSGGMWGGTREAVPNMERSLLRQGMTDTYIQDMNFLNHIIWPIAKLSVYQHDSFSCEKFGGGHPFPTHRLGLEHVGSVYINGIMRKADTDILKKTNPPPQCNINVTLSNDNRT